jgi:hypothetical protein
MAILRVFALSTVLLLAACEGSVVSNLTSSERREVTIDGVTVSVLPLSDHWASWYSGPGSAIPPLPRIKAAQIHAIEQISGCKVSGAEFQTGSLQSAYLQAVVQC